MPECKDEIEITPEMVSAGVSALPLFESEALGSLTEDCLVSEVYLAMEAARLLGERDELCSQDEGVVFSLDGNVLGLTPEMVEAGGRVIAEMCDAAPYWSKHIAHEVFKQMIKACR